MPSQRMLALFATGIVFAAGCFGSDPVVGVSVNGSPDSSSSGSGATAGEQAIKPAPEFAMPTTPAEVVAQLLRAIELEDRDSFVKLIYRIDTLNGGTTREQQHERAQSLFESKQFGIKRVSIAPLSKPVPAQVLSRPGNDETRLILRPDPTHDIKFEYEKILTSGARVSGYYVGQEDGIFYISSAQPEH